MIDGTIFRAALLANRSDRFHKRKFTRFVFVIDVLTQLPWPTYVYLVLRKWKKTIVVTASAKVLAEAVNRVCMT